MDRVRDALAAVNRDYEARFGYIYIVCAAGKVPEELLAIARRRLANEPSAELGVAAGEQHQITRLRLRAAIERTLMSTLSTHVLDTSLGRPASGVAVLLERVRDATGGDAIDQRDVSLGAGATDKDGRLRDFLSAGKTLGEGTYRLRFDIGEYFGRQSRAGVFSGSSRGVSHRRAR